MARLNIEEHWWTDPRRFKLIEILGNNDEAEDRADIAMIRVWRVAQEFWKHGRRPIPTPVFMKIRNAQNILDVGLAKHDGARIYAKGSSVSFRWLIEAQVSGTAGGLASGESRRRKNEGKSKGSRREVEPSSSSSSSSSNTNTIAQRVEHIYRNLYPLKKGKTPGLKKLARDVKTEDDLVAFEIAVKRYAAEVRGQDPKYIKHFSTFASQWRDWVDQAISQPKELTLADLEAQT